MEHTPGPWWWDERTESIGSPAGWICGLAGHGNQKSDVPFGDQEADARLIAAAPEMMKALEAEEALRDHLRECDAFNTPDGKCAICLRLATDANRLRYIALAKVRGDE